MEWLENFFEWAVDAIDINGSTVVDFSDAEEAMNHATEAAISLADQNDSGSIEFGDLTTAVFSFIDRNGSGQLESEDFQEMLLGFVDKNGDGQFTSIDRIIWKLGAEVGENFGPVTKIAFLNAAKHLL
jgi:hypothetical protein